MVNRSFSSHYYDYYPMAMGRLYNEGKGWKKHGFIPLSGVSRSYTFLPTYPPIYLPGASPFDSCPSGARRGGPRAGWRPRGIQFFPFYRTLRAAGSTPVSRKRSSPSRDAPNARSPLAVRVYANFAGALCLLAAWLPPAPLRASTKDPGQTFIRLGIFIFRSGETTKRVTPYVRRPRRGEEGMGRREEREHRVDRCTFRVARA